MKNRPDLFKPLVENALDFLEQSLKEFKRDPKYSVIHFYAAVELFLKARLYAEHWTLVVSPRQDADWTRFQKGDFQSVTLREAMSRLDKVVQSGLTKPEQDILEAIGKHRNQMMHFFHEATSDREKKSLLQQVAREQLVGCHVLRRLLQQRWKSQFVDYENRVWNWAYRLKTHREYLKVVFDEMVPELEKLKAQGVLLKDCPACGYESLKYEEILEEFYGGPCMVCETHHHWLNTTCPNCGDALTLEDEGRGTCNSCHKAVEPNDILSALQDSTSSGMRYFDSDGLPAHCVDCDTPETVIAYDGQYLCLSCFTVFDAEELSNCEGCNELNAGQLKNSYLSGCVMCDGHGDWDG